MSLVSIVARSQLQFMVMDWTTTSLTEGKMFEVTEKAAEKIREAFKDREKVPSIRIQLTEGG